MKADSSVSRNQGSEKSSAKILVPLDCSDCSIEAIKNALELANHNDSITLLQVIDFISVVSSVGPTDWPVISQRSAARATRFFDAIQRDFGPSLQFKTAIVPGYAHEVIVDYAAQHGFDLIILGVKPHHWLQWFRRHTVARVQLAAPCEVIVIALNNKAGHSDHRLTSTSTAPTRARSDHQRVNESNFPLAFSSLFGSNLKLEHSLRLGVCEKSSERRTSHPRLGVARA